MLESIIITLIVITTLLISFTIMLYKIPLKYITTVSILDVILVFLLFSIPSNYILYTIDTYLQIHYYIKLSLIWIIQFTPILLLLLHFNKSQIIYNKINQKQYKSILTIIPILVLTTIEIQLDIPSLTFIGIENTSIMIMNQFVGTGELNYISTILFVATLFLLSRFKGHPLESNIGLNLSIGWVGVVSLLMVLTLLMMQLKNFNYDVLTFEVAWNFVFSLLFLSGIAFLLSTIAIKVKPASIAVIGYTTPVLVTSILLLSLLQWINIWVLIAVAFIVKYFMWSSAINYQLNKVASSAIIYNRMNDIKTNFIFLTIFMATLIEVFRDQIITMILAPSDNPFISNKINSYALAFDPQYTTVFIVINSLILISITGFIVYAFNKIHGSKH